MQLSLTNPNQAAIHLTWQMPGDLSMHESLASELVLGCDGSIRVPLGRAQGTVAPEPARVSEWGAFCDLSSKEELMRSQVWLPPTPCSSDKTEQGSQQPGQARPGVGFVPRSQNRAFSLEWLQEPAMEGTQSGLEQHRHGSSGWSEK